VVSVTRCFPAASGAFLGSPCARTFLRWSLLLGLLHAFINPPFAVNDERSHLPRAHELSKGRLVSPVENGERYQLVPKSYKTAIQRYGRVAIAPEARVKLRRILKDLLDRSGLDQEVRVTGGAAEYTPIAYLPQLPALGLSRWLGLSPLVALYLARLSSVLACSLLAATGVALAGSLRWAFFALGLMPMFITQAAGVSGDGMTDALALLFTALLAKGTFESALSRRELGLLLLLSALLVCCKPPYLLLSLGIPCLKIHAARQWPRRVALLALALAIDGALLAGWRLVQGTAEVDAGEDFGGHLALLRADPLQSAGMLMSSVWANLDDLTIQMVSVRDLLSRQLTFVGAFVAALYLQLLACLAFGVHARGEYAARMRVRIAALLIVGSSTATFYLAMLLSFTQVGAPLIRGVQGRYFLPLAPLGLLALATFGRPVLARWLVLGGQRRVLTPILACHALCLASLCARYYLSSHVDWPY
jgi:uncharacterized membrane protein